jgi:hypothetical protein
MLEIVQLPDAPQSFALTRRHRNASGRMVDTTLSIWPTRNAAHDALYDELHAILIPRRSRRLERVADTGGTVAACLTLVAVALAGLLWFGASDTAGAYAGAPYTIMITLTAAQLQDVLNAAYIAEGNGEVEFDADTIDAINAAQCHLDNRVDVTFTSHGDEQ